MLNKRLTKIVAFILCFFTTAYLFPLEVMAYELNENRADAQLQEEAAVSTQSVEYDPQAKVVMEIESSRDEFQKEFLLDNGQRMYVLYPNAVHYDDDGEWLEIDNTLKAATMDNEAVYTNTAGNWDVVLPQSIGVGKTIEVSKDGYTLGMSFIGKETAPSGTGTVTMGSISASEEAKLITEQVRTSTAEIENHTVTFSESNTRMNQISADKLGSAVTYSEVFTDVDIRYDLISNYLKESIIVNVKPTGVETYKYLITAENMEMILQEDNSIHIYAKDTSKREEPIFFMPAPYMTDYEGRACFDIEVSVELTRDGYLLTYSPSYEWMSSDERVYPIIIDPAIKPDRTKANISDQTIFSKQEYHSSWGMVEAGYYSTTGVARFFLMYESLPELTSSDMIVYADIQLYKLQNSSISAYISVHKVPEVWNAETITWADRNNYNTTIEDFQQPLSYGWYTWDVTDIVKGWYEGENTGMMFKSEEAVENGNTNNFKQFCSSDYGGNKMPITTITHVNNNGLEECWDYTTHIAGRAGTGHINNYTGNLVWVMPGLGFAGNLMPVSIEHIYNANDAVPKEEDSEVRDTNEFGMGHGWRTNYNQTVKEWLPDTTYYVWDDEDGTKHYFEKTSTTPAGTTYTDELGTGNTIMVTDDGATLTFKDGSTQTFDSQGRLTQISNNQATPSTITITYENDTKRISTITDGAGRVYRFTYSGSFINKIAFLGKGTTEISCMHYYSVVRNVDVIEYPDGNMICFEYTSDNLIDKVSTEDGFELDYTYTSRKPYRVIGVSASERSTAGGTVNISYGHNQTAFVDHNGNQLIYQFNDWGNTVSIQDGEGHAQFAEYATDNPEVNLNKANQMIQSSKLQNTVSNMIRNSSFELGENEDDDEYWIKHVSDKACGSNGYSTEQNYLGDRSYLITGSSTNTDYRVKLNSDHLFTLTPGETYTFSAYVMTYEMSTTGGGATIAIGTPNGELLAESYVLNGNSNWTRLEVTYTHPETSSSTTATPFLINRTVGKAYFDCVQLEKSAGASRYNIIENGDFTYQGSASTEAFGWSEGDGCTTTENRTTYTESAAPQLDTNVYSATGYYNLAKRCYQDIPISGSKGDVYTIAGWAKGDSVPLKSDDRRFGLIVRFYNTDGTTHEEILNFNADARSDIDWQYAAKRIKAEKNYSSIRVSIVYENNANVVYFDGIQLFTEEFGYRYEYDEHGNVTGVTDFQGQTTTYAYRSNDTVNYTEEELQKQEEQGKVRQVTIQNNSDGVEKTYTYTYDYDDYGNLTSSISPEGITTTYEYDDYGNNTSVTVSNNSRSVTAITTEAKYTLDKNYVASVTDSRGKVTTYNYNPDTGVLESVQEPGGSETPLISYDYDNLYRTTAVTKGNTSNTYTYTDDLLTQSTSAGGTVYTYNYGLFDLPSNIKVGNRTLISHEYDTDDENGTKIPTWNLLKSTYGNGDYITYTYDDLGRTTGIGYEDNANAVQYKYTNDGDLGVVIDNINNLTTKYYYDLQGRMMGYDEKYKDEENNQIHQRIRVMWGYDDQNNLTAQEITVNGTTYTEEYEYDDDNRVTKTTAGNVVSSYEYDNLNRMTKITNKNSSTAVVTTDITYLSADNNTTTLIHTWKNTYSNTNKTYTYTYDDRGNITSISDGTNTTTYVYDQYDQLTRENNQAAGKTWIYTYDTAGNILSKMEYAYTTGNLGTAIDTINYGYTDATWHELLTSYDGNTITYDRIGNMLSDGTWTYEWEHGRQLASATNDTTSVSYEYNADGMRLSKTVGSTTTKYYYVGSQLVEMTQGSNKLHFTYDATGASAVTYNGTTYYYLKNAQGDILGIVNTSGTVVVSYTYDAWGNVLSVTGSMASTLGAINPLRYRGYVYDTETGLYYLQTRYYDPSIGRFICADGLTSTGQGTLGTNMYAYCNNNPVSCCDPTGESLLGAMIGGAIGGAIISTVSYIVNAGINGESISGRGLFNAALTGGITGAIGGAIGTISAATDVITTVAKGIASVGVGIAVGIKAGIEDDGSGLKRVATGISAGLITAGSTFLGSLIGTEGFGFAGTLFTNFATTLFVGTPAEIVNVLVQQGINAIDDSTPTSSFSRNSALTSFRYANNRAISMAY